MTSTLDFSLRYAELGWPVLPCHARAKAPATPRGYLDASTDPDQIRAWWTAAPEANVAIAIPDGIVIVDIDDPGALDRLRHQDRELPTTVTSITSRGKHLWYRHSVDSDLPASLRLEGADLKLRGGYVLVPPSIHPSGDRYQWEVPPSPANLTDAPDWIEAELRRKPESSTVANLRSLSIDVLAGVGQGERNRKLFEYACSCRGRGLPLEEAQVLVSHAAGRCRPPLPAREIAQILRSAWKYDPGLPSQGVSSSVVEIQDLLARDFPAMNWVVPGLICEGLVILASAPKVGKSWMALNLSLAVANGGFFLGRDQVAQGEVLYLDLEQPPRRTQARLKAIPWTSEHSGLWFAHEWPVHGHGGFRQLGAWLTEHPAARLVVVDVLQKLKGSSLAHRGTNAYEADYNVYSALKAVADKHGVGIVALHHDRKADTSDELDKISGSRALVGAADGVLILSRRRSELSGLLMATGREIADQRIPIYWSPDHRVWVATDAQGEPPTNVGERIRNQVAGPVPT